MTGEAIFPKERVSLEPTLPAKRARYYSQENNLIFPGLGFQAIGHTAIAQDCLFVRIHKRATSLSGAFVAT